ncbi:MAG: hypothetical protein J0H17_13915 [Rhizobiales bacterium]|nr:hypothetical protein [Hyphomicrobiales bacterium]
MTDAPKYPSVVPARLERAKADAAAAEPARRRRRADKRRKKQFDFAAALVTRGNTPSEVRRAVAEAPDLRMTMVESPVSGRREPALKSLRDDPLGRMAKRGQISVAQEEAGRLWQGYFEAAEIGGARAIDTTKESVDGGRLGEPFTDEQRRAVRKLAEARTWLGEVHHRLVERVLGHRMFLYQVAALDGMNPESRSDDMRYLSRTLKAALDVLAEKFGKSGIGTTTRGLRAKVPADAAAQLAERHGV